MNYRGYYFMGTDDEFEIKHPTCKDNYMPFSDEEGRYDRWLCCKDYKECDLRCMEHHKPRKLDPDWEVYFNATCERYRKDD